MKIIVYFSVCSFLFFIVFFWFIFWFFLKNLLKIFKNIFLIVYKTPFFLSFLKPNFSFPPLSTVFSTAFARLCFHFPGGEVSHQAHRLTGPEPIYIGIGRPVQDFLCGKALSALRKNGLPRRFAPRNDRRGLSWLPPWGSWHGVSRD